MFCTWRYLDKHYELLSLLSWRSMDWKSSSKCPCWQRLNWLVSSQSTFSPIWTEPRYLYYAESMAPREKKKDIFENRRKEQRPVSLTAETARKALAGVSGIAEVFPSHLPSPSGRETSGWEYMKGFAVGNPGRNKAAHGHLLPVTAFHPRYVLGSTCFLGIPQVSSTRCVLASGKTWD